MGHDNDRAGSREAILARRAIFLSTALAAFACSPKEPVDQTGTSSHTARPSTTPPGTTSTPPPQPNTAWDKVMQQAPPMGVPASAAERERGHLTRLEQELKSRYEAVRAVWTAVPGCDPAAKKCTDWDELQKQAQTMYRTIEGNFPSSCPGAHGETASVVGRRQAHHHYIQNLLELIETRFAGIAAGYGKAGAKRWSEQLEEAKKPPPMPCLSPCPMPPLNDIWDHIPFAKGNAKLRVEDTAVKGALDSVLRVQRGHGSKAKLIVRGHADLHEPKELAEKRARAVADWLVKEGIPTPDIGTASMGSDLRIARSGADGAAANRRVDFEVVPR